MQISPAIVIAFSAIALRIHLGIVRQRLRRRQRVRTTRSNRHDPIVGFDEIAVAGEQEGRRASSTMSIASRRRSTRSVRQSLASSTAERSRLPRYCSSFDSKRAKSANESAADPAKPGQDPVVVQPPDLLCRLLDDRLAEGHLAIAGEDGPVAVANGENRRAVEGHGHF